MAEIFGAVASGAGLISLSMQLLESSQKLKGFCDTARNAPETVARLCFDLETMSLALRQFEQYRQQDILGSGLLSRCIQACEQAVSRIQAAVDKVDRLLHKTRFAGRVYMGFKEPEVRGLLEEMEHAKSSLHLAYTSYCQSWAMRESAKHAAAFALQSDHIKQLHNTVMTGNAALLGHVLNSNLLEPAALIQTQQTSVIRTGASKPRRQKRDRSYRLRVSLPLRFLNCVWELGVHQADGVWTAQISPINMRPRSAVVFDYVESGDVEAVRELLQSGQLSMRDHACEGQHCRSLSLPQLAASKGHVKLCRFLLRESPLFHQDGIVEDVFASLMYYARTHFSLGEYLYSTRYVEEFVGLLATENGMHIDLELKNVLSVGDTQASILMFTSFQAIVASQAIPLADMSFAERFSVAMRSNGWPADLFAATFRCDDPLMVATGANGAGRTALHWAAGHYGEWLKTCPRTTQGFYLDDGAAMQNAASYENLAVELMTKGSHLHACWNRGFDHLDRIKGKVSPFSSFLRGLSDQYAQYWNVDNLSDAVHRWGKMLVAAGQPLLEYVVMENKFLRANRDEMSIRDLDDEDGRLECHATELVLLEGDRLAMRVEEVWGHMWKAKPTQVPGSWPRTSSLPKTIIWKPEEEDAQEGYRWVSAGATRSRSCLITLPWLPRLPRPVDSPGSACFESWKLERFGLLDGVQDDHAFIVIILTNQSEPRGRDRPHTRRRSASEPAIERHFGSCDAGIETFGRPWSVRIHKCAFDLRWKVKDGLSVSGVRYCVQGRCHQEVGSPSPWYSDDTWEAELLKDERHVGVAGRFARRFCPEHLNLVEKTLARATERSRLPIGPPRPPKTFW